jgi:hypothetical protein
MHSAPRPASQMSKRHVVAISESLRASTPKLSIAAPLAPSSRQPLAPSSQHLPDTLDEAHVAVVPPGVAFPMPERSLPFRGSSVLNLGKGGSTVVNGFDRLELAIARLVERLPESTLEDKFALVSKWIESYHVDVVPRRLSEQLTLLLSAAAPGWPHDTENRRTDLKQIIINSFSLHQLMLVLTRLKPILAPIIERVTEGIFGAIFMEPIPLLPRVIIDANLDRETLISEMKCFQQRTFFQECRDNERRLASVKEFMIDREKMRQRQLNVLRSALQASGAYSVGLCFRAWRGYVGNVSTEKVRESEMNRLLDDRAALRSQVASLEAKLAASTAEVELLTKANAHLSARLQDATDANKFDSGVFRGQIERLEKSIAAANADLDERQSVIQELRLQAETLHIAVSTEIAALREGFLNYRAPRAAREAWLAANGPTTIVSDATSCAWLYEAARRAVAEHCDDLQSLHVEPAALRDSIAAAKPLSLNNASLNALLLALLHLLPASISMERTAELLRTPFVVDKIVGLTAWAKEQKIPLGFCAAEQLLLDSSPWALRSVAGHLLAFVTSNEKTAPSFSACATVASQQFVAIWQDVSAIQSQAVLQNSAVDYAARCSCNLNRDHVVKLERPLSVQEQADRGLFNVAAADLRPAGVDEAQVPAVQHAVRIFYPFLRQLFRSYSGVEGAGSAGIISEYGFTRLVKDARIAQVGAIEASLIRSLVGEGMSARRFTAVLVQLATVKFGDADAAASFVTLLHRLRPLAVMPSTVDVALSAMEGDEIFAGLLSDMRPDLLKIFRKYCTEGLANRMGIAEFLKLMMDIKVIDEATLTNPEVRELFQSANPLNGTITFDGFVQLNCLVGLTKIRMPWATATARASKFLHDVLILPLQRKLALATPCVL